MGLFNRFDWPNEIEVDFHQLGFKGRVRPRDVWAGKDVEMVDGKYRARVPGHGVVLLRAKAE